MMKCTVLRVMLATTVVLVALSLSSYVWLQSLWQARSSLGPVVFYIWVMITIPTFFSLMLTVGIWIFQRNRSVG